MNRILSDRAGWTGASRLRRIGSPGAIALCAALLAGVPDAMAQLPVADLSITKTGPATVNPGQTFQYTFTIANHGPDNGLNAAVTDALPAGLGSPLITSNSNPALITCTLSGTSISCANSNMSLGSATVVVSVQVSPSVPPGTVVTNTATISTTSMDPNSSNNTSTTSATVQVLPGTPAPPSLTLVLVGLGVLLLYAANRRLVRRL